MSRPSSALSLSETSPDLFGSTRCDHCGNRFERRFAEERFCCSGCRVVHDLIRAGGLGNFYSLLGNQLLQPAAANDIDSETLAELTEAVAEAEAERSSPDSPARLTLRLGNLSCTACVWLVDHLFHQHQGSLRQASDTSRSTLTIWWNPGEFPIMDFLQDLHRYGYPASICRPEDEEAPQESRALLTRLGVTSGLSMNTMAFTLPMYLGLSTGDELARLFTLVAFASATLALLVGGSYFFQRALSSIRARALHMDVPIALGLLAAWIGSVVGFIFEIDGMVYFDFVAIFSFLMLSGRYVHLRLLDRNRRQLWAREQEITTSHRINREGLRERIPLRQIEAGDLLEILPGAMAPVASILESESSSLLLDWINGEPDPIRHSRGQQVPAGARNGSSQPMRVIATEAFRGSFLERLFAATDDEFDQHSAATSTHPVRKFYLIGVLIIAFGGGLGWILAGKGLAPALQVLISVLVVSCPCALGLALPLLDELNLARLRQHGLFIRRHSMWSRLKSVNRLCFDKTGTLTEPIRRLAHPEVIHTLSEESLFALRLLTFQNTHPIGQALREVIMTHFGPVELTTEISLEETPGRGVSIQYQGATWRLGRSDWAVDAPRDEAVTCALSRDGQWVAGFEFEEAIRDGATKQLRSLQEHGYRITILSGDPDHERVKTTAMKLGIAEEEVLSDLSPDEKAAAILADHPERTLFVGDGGNDGPAFDVAAVTGSPATGIRAIESRADFVFTGRGFHAIPLLFRAADRRKRRIVTLFVVALTYNIGAIALCLIGYMSPLLAAILMPLSSILATSIAAKE